MAEEYAELARPLTIRRERHPIGSLPWTVPAPHIPPLRISPPPAGEGREALEGAIGAPEPREAMGQDAAGEELTELLLDESGQAVAVAAVGDVPEEGLEVLTNDGVQHGVLGVAGPIRGVETCPPWGSAGWERRQCPEMDTRHRGWGGPLMIAHGHYFRNRIDDRGAPLRVLVAWPSRGVRAG